MCGDRAEADLSLEYPCLGCNWHLAGAVSKPSLAVLGAWRGLVGVGGNKPEHGVEQKGEVSAGAVGEATTGFD